MSNPYARFMEATSTGSSRGAPAPLAPPSTRSDPAAAAPRYAPRVTQLPWLRIGALVVLLGGMGVIVWQLWSMSKSDKQCGASGNAAPSNGGNAALTTAPSSGNAARQARGLAPLRPSDA